MRQNLVLLPGLMTPDDDEDDHAHYRHEFHYPLRMRSLRVALRIAQRIARITIPNQAWAASNAEASNAEVRQCQPTSRCSPEMLAAEYRGLLPDTAAAQDLLTEGIAVEEPFLQAVHALRVANEQGTLDTTDKTFDQQMAAVIAGRMQALRQRIRRPPRNLYGHGAYTIVENYEARMTVLCLVMAQNPVALDDESYLRLEKLLMMSHRSHQPIPRRRDRLSRQNALRHLPLRHAMAC